MTSLLGKFLPLTFYNFAGSLIVASCARLRKGGNYKGNEVEANGMEDSVGGRT